MTPRTMPTLSGFLLTRHWRDTPRGLELEFWAASERGPLRLVFEAQEAVCFIRREQALPASMCRGLNLSRRALDLKSLDGAPLDGLYFKHQRDLVGLRERAAAQGIALLESDIKPSERFLMERFIHAAFELRGELRPRRGYLECRNPALRTADYRPDLRYAAIDIETSDLDGELYSIAVLTQDSAWVFMLGEAPPRDDPPMSFHASERALLEHFLTWLHAEDPDLIIGWNLVDFDLDFLERRCRRLGLGFAFARGGQEATILQPQSDTQPRIARLSGRVALDGIALLKSATWSFESFELESVARQLLGRGKLIEEPQDRLQAIRDLFARDKPQLARYNLEDCRLTRDIFETAGLIDFAMHRAGMTGLALERQGGSVAAFDNLYLPRLHRRGYAAPDIGASENRVHSPGGYVMDSRPGLYDNVLVLDFKSLYPSIIRSFKIDPLGLHTAGEDAIPGFLDAHFARHDAILPQLIEQLWHERDEAKRQANATLSQAIKIIMNSFYGVLGSFGCRFFDPRLASSITRRGHEIITRSREVIEQGGHEVIYGDTDSLFVLLGPGYSQAQALEAGRELAATLNQWWRESLAERFQIDSCLEIEFETHYVRFLMPTVRGAETGSKKRYAGCIKTDDGYQLVFKGLESVRTDWTPLARGFQRELYRRVFFDEPYESYIRDTVARLNRGELDGELVYHKRLRRRLDDYVRNVPPHVQAARKQSRPGKSVRYLITRHGPEPVDNTSAAPDYEHYIERQLAPIANAILYFLDTRFEDIIARQLSMF